MATNVYEDQYPAPGNIALHDEEERDDLLVFAGAGTVKRGTILARVGSNYVPFAPGGSGGAEIPVAVLGYEVSAAGAGNVSCRAIVSGKVNKNRLIIHADGHGLNITNAIIDGLRDFGIVPLDVAQLGPAI